MSKIKNIMDKLRPDVTGNKQAANVERISVLTHSTDAIGWKPVNYTVPEQYEAFLAGLDSDIENFISRANPDQYNPRFFEKTIEEQVTLALKELESQRTKHNNSIHNIRVFQLGCLEDISNQLHSLDDAITKIKEEM